MNRSFFLLTGLALLLAVVSTFGSATNAGAEDSDSPTDSKSTWITSIAPLGSNKFVAASAGGLLLREASVYSFNADDPTTLTPLYKHPAAVWCVDSTSDGGKIVSVDYRGNLVIFDAVTGEEKMHEKAFERWCQAMMIAPSGTSIVAGNEAGKIMTWDLIAGKVIKSAELGGHAVTGVAISPDQSRLAASDGSGQVHLLAWPTLEPLGKIKVTDQPAWCVAFVDDGTSLLVGSSDRHLYRCEATDGATPVSVVKGSDWITQLAVSPSGQVAAGEVGGRLHFPTTGGTDSMDASSGVWALCWNSNSQLFAGTRKDGIVTAGRSWKWAPAKPAVTEPKEESAKSTEEMPAEEKPAEEKPAEEKPAEEKPAEAKPAEEKPAEEKPAEEKPADEKPADEKPADEKPADEKPVEEKPAEEKPAEPESGDAPQSDAKKAADE